MDLDLFLPPNHPEANPALNSLGARYPGLFRERRHSSRDPLFTRYWLASLPLDGTTGHWLAGDRPAAEITAGYGSYGSPYPSPTGYETILGPDLPAVALWNRIVLVPAEAGAPARLRPGLYRAPFHHPALLRAAFHRALEETLGELRTAYAALLRRYPGPCAAADAARLLGVTEAALRRALW